MTDPSSVFTSPLADLDADLLQLAGLGLAVGVVLYVVRSGWRVLTTIVNERYRRV